MLANGYHQKRCQAKTIRIDISMNFLGLLDPLLTHIYHYPNNQPNTDFTVFSSTFHIKKVNPPNKTHQKYRCENCHTTRDSVDLFFLRTSTMPFGLGIFLGFGFTRQGGTCSALTAIRSASKRQRSLLASSWESFLCVFFGGDDVVFCVHVFLLCFFLLLGVCCFFGVVFLKRTAFWTWKEATLFSVHFWRWYCWEWFIFMR